ncbi:Flp pilus assembly complex ATPase component TadA [Burkholderiaceae bacterium DAT-1]|nr:Flp pilus assembly complex ATPase component TadA [Burkholderiaceae bacterium DAT-1]
MKRPQKFRLGELLVQQSLVTQDQLDQALISQKHSGRRLGRVLVESGMVSDEQIAVAIARQLNIRFVDLRSFVFDKRVVNMLPESMARRFRAILLAEEGDAYLLGMSDPSDVFAYDEIARTLKREVDIAVLSESQVALQIDKLYRRTEEISGLAKELERDLAGTYSEFASSALSGGAEDAPVVKLLQTIFEDACQIRASDIHIEPQESRLQIRFRIDGLLHLQNEADNRILPALVLRLKLMSGLDISEKRLPQDGRFNVTVKGQSVDVRISTLPTQYGECVVMRLLAQSTGILDLSNLGMPMQMLARFRQMIHASNGMVLVTGPTGSGKTTTLYAALSELNAAERKIITVEDPVEYRLAGINQVQVNDKIDLNFARVLRATLRQDPDILLVGEMRDEETAQIGMRAAMTGHLVLSTLHTNDAASAPSRLIDMGIPRFLVSTSLLGVVAQRLLRKICDHCKTPVPPLANERTWLEAVLPDRGHSAVCYQGQGCAECSGTGYLGRIAVYELLDMNRSMLDVLSHIGVEDFPAAAREQMGRTTLKHHAAARVFAGETTVREAMRVVSAQDD